MLIDNAKIFVRSGKGGHGCVSMRREKYRPRGGPDGGDGGKGGDVILVGDESLNTLLSLTPRPHYRAESGRPGEGSSCFGRNGVDCIIPVPLGTIICDFDTGEVIGDIDLDGQRMLVALGGEGGFGNEHFKSSTNQAPRESTPGGTWEEKTLALELKLIADVGLVGLPNAGKSTLLGAMSRAHPRVAAYPFTTLSPNLGTAELPGHRRLIVADIPGLIEGAADGAGLGHDFLRHIERTRVLLHVLDVDPMDGSDPSENYKVIRQELDAYEADLAGKPEIILLNKMDLVPEDLREEFLEQIESGLGHSESPRLIASGVTGEGVAEVLEFLWKLLNAPQPDFKSSIDVS
ncbi:MAG: Obg family GTPase CgtA [Phycisphaerales bacterium]|nr:Obg family GTPase CgtA [Phycisphaerales bacterium]